MAKIEKSIDVNVPVREAYNQWTQFESFPQFMEGVESVRQQGDTNLHWVATIAGKRQEWDAEITEQTPDQRIAWRSTTGDRNAGAVDFHRVSDDQTRITLTMDVEPSGAVEAIGTALGIPSGQVEGDLKRFKEFIESRGSATGAWRGEVDQNDVSGTSGSSREMAGAGTMGSTGSSTDLGSDYGTSSGTASGGVSGYEGDYSTGTTGSGSTGTSTGSTGTTTGTTGTGEMGSGMNNPQDLGTGRRENDSGF
jgi:carbon monoxide dehydrogenase subunit G